MFNHDNVLSIEILLICSHPCSCSIFVRTHNVQALGGSLQMLAVPTPSPPVGKYLIAPHEKEFEPTCYEIQRWFVQRELIISISLQYQRCKQKLIYSSTTTVNTCCKCFQRLSCTWPKNESSIKTIEYLQPLSVISGGANNNNNVVAVTRVLEFLLNMQIIFRFSSSCSIVKHGCIHTLSTSATCRPSSTVNTLWCLAIFFVQVLPASDLCRLRSNGDWQLAWYQNIEIYRCRLQDSTVVVKINLMMLLPLSYCEKMRPGRYQINWCWPSKVIWNERASQRTWPKSNTNSGT